MGSMTTERHMKKLLFSTVAFTGLLAASLQAGPAVEYKQVAPPPPPLYGLGFYGGIDMGANIYQDRGGDRTFTQNDPNDPFFGYSLDVNPKNDVGFFGGIKLGYVFGTGIVRPTIEGIRNGLDEVLEEALRQILGRQTPIRSNAFYAVGPGDGVLIF